ncbi:hypothetical protein [Bacillus sp. REN16]|uniref:hypothetical protein n=1 Tax=Bacillus sp. REN16 TaxID=2887296 RepID=UPI001E2F8BCE|nr:hypothetical protein [Bacillus sp. REN16]MCC3359127.1 hypothetical protein [Bacillus sp. REN16]
MNTSGFIRGLMSRNMEGEKFFIHVATFIEQQLQEWDPDFKVFVMMLENYEMFVTGKQESLQLTMTDTEIITLQQRDPYALDRKIWREMEQEGLQIRRGSGNYLSYVFMEK